MNGDIFLSPFISKIQMMILTNGTLKGFIPHENQEEDILEIEWYETSKSVLRRKTLQQREIGLKKQDRTPLQDGDILYAEDAFFIKVSIKPCDCIVVQPRNITEMGMVCFEIGNMHLPIFIDGLEQVNVAYEAPLYDFLQRKNYECFIENKKLLQTQMLNIHQIKR